MDDADWDGEDDECPPDTQGAFDYLEGRINRMRAEGESDLRSVLVYVREVRKVVIGNE